MTKRHERIIVLYRTMPGAPMPPSDENGYIYWGDVEGNDHWAFCEEIVRMTDDAIAAAVNRLASDHNLV